MKTLILTLAFLIGLTSCNTAQETGIIDYDFVFHTLENNYYVKGLTLTQENFHVIDPQLVEINFDTMETMSEYISMVTIEENQFGYDVLYPEYPTEGEDYYSDVVLSIYTPSNIHHIRGLTVTDENSEDGNEQRFPNYRALSEYIEYITVKDSSTR